ncbi:hypothetical protein Btru_055909 [Bulinus truncatus]|nr:hypothetical protein Btru_055909 [Bulinus truncatus]
MSKTWKLKGVPDTIRVNNSDLPRGASSHKGRNKYDVPRDASSQKGQQWDLPRDHFISIKEESFDLRPPWHGQTYQTLDNPWTKAGHGSSVSLHLLLPDRGVGPGAVRPILGAYRPALKASLTVTSLTMMIQILFLSISSIIVVSVLLPKFGERKVTVLAGVIFAGCSIGCSLAPDIVVFIIFCAIQALMETYGLRGTFLFLAGLELNMVVAGMLLRPLSCYRTKNQLEKKLLNEKEDDEKHDAGIIHDSISSRAETDQSDRSAYSKITNQNPATLDGANEVTVAARDNNKGSADVANDVTAEARSADVANGQNGSKHPPTSNKRLIKERPA